MKLSGIFYIGCKNFTLLMGRCITLLTAFFLIPYVLFSQDLRKRMGRTVYNPDSAAIIFEIEKQHLQTATDSGVYFYFLAEKFNVDRENEKAEEFFIKSLELVDPNSPNQDLISLACIRLNRLSSISGQFDKALMFSQNGLQNATAALDSNFMGYALLDISGVYHDMEQFEKGVEYGKKAYQLLTTYSDARPTFIAFSLNSIAINFDDWNKPDSALHYHFKVLENIENLDSTRISFTFNNIANTLLKQGKYTEAEPWLNTAVKVNSKTMDDYSLAANYTNLATIAYKKNDFVKAQVMLDSAYKYVEESQSTEKKRDYLFEQYGFNKSKGNYSLAMDYLEQYMSVKDSIFKEERIKTIGEMETKFQLESKERELAESRASLAENELLVENQNNQLLLLFILILILFGFGFFIYNRQKNKNRLLEQEAKLQAIYAEQETQKRLHEERNRISSDLHDNIGAQLTFIISSLNNLKFGKLDTDRMAAKIDQISGFTIETINELRDTIWAMNKDSISVEDLEARLANFILKAKSSCPQMEFSIEIDPDLDRQFLLNSLEGVNYYRVVQEAVNNAIKHSEASKISIHFQLVDNKIRICVVDNGLGFPEQKSFGNGLGTMRSRAERMGSELTIHTSEGQGTEVCII